MGHTFRSSDLICRFAVFLAISVRSDLGYRFFLPYLFTLDHSFEGGSPATHLALLGGLRTTWCHGQLECVRPEAHVPHKLAALDL